MFNRNSNNRRARGTPSPGRGTPVRGRGGHAYNGIDVVIQRWPQESARGGSSTPPPNRRGSPFQSQSEYSSLRGSGRGRGRATNHGGSSQANGRRGRKRGMNDAPLSQLLHEARPYLRPIKFVRSVHTRTLFEEVEEILQPSAENAGDDTSCMPTAKQVTRIFSGGKFPRLSSPAEDGEEKLEEIQFEDMARFRGEFPALSVRPPSPDITAVEEKFMGFYINRDESQPAIPTMPAHPEIVVDLDRGDMADSTAPPIIPNDTQSAPDLSITNLPGITPLRQRGVDAEAENVHACQESTIAGDPIVCDDTEPTSLAPNTDSDHGTLQPMQDAALESLGFYIDTEPTPVSSHDIPTASQLTEGIRPLGQTDVGDDQEIIVYVAPYRRSPTNILEQVANSRASLSNQPAPQPPPPTHVESPAVLPVPTFDSISLAFPRSPTKSKQPRHPFAFNARNKAKVKLRAQRRDIRSERKRQERNAIIRTFGAEKTGMEMDKRWEQRRRGDSDLDWGDESDEENDEVLSSHGAIKSQDGTDGEMELDPELTIDLDAMQSFVKGMKSGFVTMDDIADEERMRREDEQASGSESGEDEDVDAALHAEEEVMLAEPRDASYSAVSDSESDEEDHSSGDDGDTPKTSFLARLNRLRDQSLRRNVFGDNDVEVSLALDEADDLISQTAKLLDEVDDNVHTPKMRARNKLFRALRDRDHATMERVLQPNRKDKHVPPELRTQWEQDRAKKAEHKRARAEARQAYAADPFTSKHSGKKSHKAVLAAAKAAEQGRRLLSPHQIVDKTSLLTQVRSFVEDTRKVSMSLPPMAKEDRKKVHELANAFGLTSRSCGYGAGRYTTLVKRGWGGEGVDEKIKKIMKGSGGRFWQGKGKGKETVSAVKKPGHREGDEVGKEAPKIGESNIGFKMLQAMGWTEGERVGCSGGLEAPIAAVIKRTKLGLGATL